MQENQIRYGTLAVRVYWCTDVGSVSWVPPPPRAGWVVCEFQVEDGTKPVWNSLAGLPTGITSRTLAPGNRLTHGEGRLIISGAASA